MHFLLKIKHIRIFHCSDFCFLRCSVICHWNFSCKRKPGTQFLSLKTKVMFKKGRVEKHSETQEYKQCSILIKNVLFLIKICNCVSVVSSFNHVRPCLEYMSTYARALTHSHWILHVYDVLWLFRKAKWDKVFNPAAAWQNIHPGVSVRTHCHRLTTSTTSDAILFHWPV